MEPLQFHIKGQKVITNVIQPACVYVVGSSTCITCEPCVSRFENTQLNGVAFCFILSDEVTSKCYDVEADLLDRA